MNKKRIIILSGVLFLVLIIVYLVKYFTPVEISYSTKGIIYLLKEEPNPRYKKIQITVHGKLYHTKIFESDNSINFKGDIITDEYEYRDCLIYFNNWGVGYFMDENRNNQDKNFLEHFVCAKDEMGTISIQVLSAGNENAERMVFPAQTYEEAKEVEDYINDLSNHFY